MELRYIVNNNKYINVKEVLKSYFQISDRLLTKLKKNQKILINNSTIYINKEISIGDIITVKLDFKENNDNVVPTKMNLNIIFEDEALLILNKPAGIAVHSSISHFEDTLSNGVKYYFNSINLNKKIRPVNRLDKDTSGIIVFAKNEYIQEALIRQMKNKQFKKQYYAILEGFLEENSGIINVPISRKENSIIEREININGDIAITHFELIKKIKLVVNKRNNNIIKSIYNNISYDDNLNIELKENKHLKKDYLVINLSLTKFILETGRTHQIRLHSKYINHPILGDSLYGNKSDLIPRQALHAYKISFIHPITKKIIELEIPFPEDFNKII